MIVLTNDTIKEIERDIKRNDEPDNVGSEKAKRFLQTDWDLFKDNPTFLVLKEDKDTVFKPELPDGLPMERKIEHRIDVKDPSVAMYRQQWRLSPKQKTEIDKWVRDMISKGLIRPISGIADRSQQWTSDHASTDIVFIQGISTYPVVLRRQLHLHYIFTKSKDIAKHLQALREVLEILKVNKLYVKLSKCVFCAEEIPCLGDFIGRNGVHIDPDKVQTIRDCLPRTPEQLHSFLGLTGYVQRFCEQYADLTAPLFTLLKKKNLRNSKITLDAGQLKNFKELQERLADTPVLHLPDFTRKMKSAEFKYPTQQQELLAIVNAFAAFRIYCLDRPVMIETDHKSLEGIFQQKMANRRLARWYDILAEYQPVFAYLPGAKNGIADALSRRPDLKPETKEFHDLLVPSFNESSYQLREIEIRPTSDLVKAIIEGYKKGNIIQDILRVIKKRSESPATRVHDSNYGGYPGTDGTYLKLQADWYWPRITRTIKKYIADCEDCRRNKPRLSKTPGLLEPLQIPDERWRSISMDFKTDLAWKQLHLGCG
ncbi:unnamed protein product [Phytophthora lilii]|uniref:Unnamed protein product n=1 Tax=Phytophthora lilii TaxID=2077276 RepID=A0A9W6TQL3_9STRA|nr:unnamed protein product [Phytophthora lilii]